MKNFLLISNARREDCYDAAETVVKTLEKNGCKCCDTIFSKENSQGKYIYADPKEVSDDIDAVLTLGGDGTLIHVAKDLLELNLPLLGINFGTLGYLTEVDIDEFESALQSVIKGEYKIEERMLLSGDIYKDDKVIYSDIALNDIAVNRAEMTSVADFDIYVDDQFLNTYVADGMIFATPTGSTGYNLSAGGPVVLPTAEIILATPICAHTLNSRSVVFPADVKMQLCLSPDRQDRNLTSCVTFDGERTVSLENGMSIIVKKAEVSAKILKINKVSFIEHLGRKMR